MKIESFPHEDSAHYFYSNNSELSFEKVFSKYNLQIMTHIVTNLAAHGYEILNMIGRGAYGEIYLVLSSKYQKEFACKVFNCKENDQTKMTKSYLKEISTLQKLSHQNIIKYYDSFQEKYSFYIILEYCSNGTLYNVIRTRHLPYTSVYKCAYQLLSALEFMHERHIAHLDIKPDNILVDEHWRLIITDFGLAKEVMPGERLHQYSGSFSYMAPEILDRKQFDPFKADIWSFGVTLYHLVIGSHPFPCRYENQIRKLVKMGYPSLPKSIPEPIQQLIAKSLVIEPDERYSASQLLELLPEAKSYQVSMSADERTKIRVNRSRMSIVRIRNPNNANGADAPEGQSPLIPKCMSFLPPKRHGTHSQLPPLKPLITN